MSDNSVARRYAQALFDLACEQDQLDIIEKELGSVVETIEAHLELKKALENQLFPISEKQAVVEAVFGNVVSSYTLNFLFLLLEKRRESFLGSMLKEYLKLANEKRNIVMAQVKTAVDMTSEYKLALAAKLAQTTGKNVHLEHTIDPSILAGAIVRIGDTVIDGSVATRLLKLRANLLSQ